MSRTHVHAPFWVQRNRAAEQDPYDYIDHDHTQRPIYDHSYVEEEYEDYTNVPYQTYYYQDQNGITREWSLYYRKPVTKTRKVWTRTLVGMTSGECDYRPLVQGSKWGASECEPSWHIGSQTRGRYSYYWHAGWGKSYTQEKDEYWGGARTEKRIKTQQWVKEYNSGESLEDVDDHFTYAEDHSFPFWW